MVEHVEVEAQAHQDSEVDRRHIQWVDHTDPVGAATGLEVTTAMATVILTVVKGDREVVIMVAMDTTTTWTDLSATGTPQGLEAR